MPRQPFQINHLHAKPRQHVQNIGLRRPGIAIQNHHAAGKWLVIKRIHYKPAPGLVAARNRLHPPTDLRQNRGERPRSLPTAPTINQWPPAAWPIRQRPLQMPCRIGRNQSRADFSGGKRTDLLVNRADFRAFCIIQHGQVYRPRQMILRPFGGCAHVNDIVKAQGGQIAQRCQGNCHAVLLSRPAARRNQNPATNRPSNVSSIASHRANCAASINSSGVCPCAIFPGPQITVGTPSRAANIPPSVP